jgi:hypothetical protein
MTNTGASAECALCRLLALCRSGSGRRSLVRPPSYSREESVFKVDSIEATMR